MASNSTHAAPADATSAPPPALTTQPALADASTTAPRLPDHGPLNDNDFARVVREPLKVGQAEQRVLKAAKISAGTLHTFIRSLRTLVTHATAHIASFCRKPKDVWSELELNRTTFYRYTKCAADLGQLRTSPAGSRGVVRFDLPRRGVTLRDADEQSRSAGRFVTAPPTSSPAQRDASRTPTTTYLSDHHQLEDEDSASLKQVRKLCALDRGAGLAPDEDRYRRLTRAAAWELIAERARNEKTATATSCALNEDGGCGRCHRCRPDEPRCVEWDRNGRGRCALLAKHDGPHVVGRKAR